MPVPVGGKPEKYGRLSDPTVPLVVPVLLPPQLAGILSATAGGDGTAIVSLSSADAAAWAAAAMRDKMLAETGLLVQAAPAKEPSWPQAIKMALAAVRNAVAEARRFPKSMRQLRTLNLHLSQDQARAARKRVKIVVAVPCSLCCPA